MVKKFVNKFSYKISLNSLGVSNQHLFAERLKNEILLLFPNLEVSVISKKKFNRQALLELECTLSNSSFQISDIKHQIDILAIDLEHRLLEHITAARLSAA